MSALADGTRVKQAAKREKQRVKEKKQQGEKNKD
jgi:hypothetical protein